MDEYVHMLWSVLPRKRRHYVKGEKLIYIDNGSKTIIPHSARFVSYGDGPWCIIHQDTIENIVHLSMIRPRAYRECEMQCRNAVICWLLLSQRARFLVKDIRILIGQTIWETREDSDWEN